MPFLLSLVVGIQLKVSSERALGSNLMSASKVDSCASALNHKAFIQQRSVSLKT